MNETSASFFHEIRAYGKDGPLAVSVRPLGEARLYHGERLLSFEQGTLVYEVTAPGYCLTHVYKHPSETITIRMVPYDIHEPDTCGDGDSGDGGISL